MGIHKKEKKSFKKMVTGLIGVTATVQAVRTIATIATVTVFVGGIASVYGIVLKTKPQEEIVEEEDHLPDMNCPCGDCTQGVEVNPTYVPSNGSGSSGSTNSGEDAGNITETGEKKTLKGSITEHDANVNSTSDRIWEFLKQAGWNDYAISGLLGNIMSECGMDHKQKTNKDVGIVQWTDNADTKRKTGFMNWAENNGGWDNIDTQLKYLFFESDYYKKMTVKMGYSAWGSIDDSTDYWINNYEQYGGYRTNNGERAKRRERAHLYYDYYTKSSLANVQIDDQLMAQLGVSGGQTTPITGDNAASGTTGGSGVKTDVTLHYSAENIDVDNWDGKVPKEYVINSCDKLIVKQHLLPSKNSGANTTIKGFVVHYWGNAKDGRLIIDPPGHVRSGDDLYSGWAAANEKTSASFSLGTDGIIWQFVALNRYSNASNDNGGTIAVEVANQLAGGQYNEVQYKALVHLTAWICYTYNLDTDFDWNMQPKSQKMYWDRGNVRRHYDNTQGGKFRGKACPAYWTPYDGKSQTPQFETPGGNLRWIAFKEDVTNFIIKYKDDPNFPITLEDGSELAGYTDSLSLVDKNYVPNWSNGKVISDNTGGNTSNLRGVGCHCAIPCPYCHCHDDVAGSGNNNGQSGNNSGGYINSDGIAIDPSLPHVNNGGEGKCWSIDEEGKFSFIGTTWQGTYFLVQARQVMQKYIASKEGYVYAGIRDLTSVGLWPGCRMDCSGYRNSVLKYLGYKPELAGDSQSDLSVSLGFTKNTKYEDMKPGDIVCESGHTEIFVGWVDQPGGDWYVYSWGGVADPSAYGNFCEPKIRRKSDKTWVCSYSPTELDVGKDTSGGDSGTGENSGSGIPAYEEIEWTSSTNSNFYISTITDSIFNRIQKSYNNCTFRNDLRYLHMQYYGFDGQVHTGEMIVNKAIARDVLEIFEELLDNKYEIERMELMDKYYTGTDGVEADDNAMRANNTSAFNFRQMTTSSTLSLHARGLAVDINTLYNPYVKGDTIKPIEGKEYADRTKNFKHKIDKNDLAYKLFIKKGFSWGGSWNSSKDYQHFEKKID